MLHKSFTKRQDYEKFVLVGESNDLYKNKAPKIYNQDISYNIIQLTRNLLSKDWKKRIKICSIQKINELTSNQNEEPLDTQFHIDQILKLRQEPSLKLEEIAKIKRTKKEINEKKNIITDKLTELVDEIFDFIKSKGLCSKVNKFEKFYFDIDKKFVENTNIQNNFYELEGDLSMGYPKNLCVLVRTENNADNHTVIKTLAMFTSSHFKYNLNDPIQIFWKIAEHNAKFKTNTGRFPIKYNSYELKFNEAFDGVIEFDNSSKDLLTSHILKLISVSLKKVEGYVSKKLEEIKNSGGLVPNIYSRTNSHIISKTIIINELPKNNF